jgi:integrase/recombinase XerC
MADPPDFEGTPTLGGCVTEFLYAREARKHAPNTLAAYRRDLEAVGVLLAGARGCPPGDLPVVEITGRALRGAFAEFARPRSAASVGRAWSVWNQFFSFLVADGVLPGNPMGTVDRPRPPHRSPKPLRGPDTPEQLLASVAGARAGQGAEQRRRKPWPERDFAIVAMLLCAGLRSSELLELRVDSIDGRAGERFVKVHGKGDKERTVPVEPELDAVVADYLRSRVARFAGRVPGRGEALFVGADGARLGRGALQYAVARAYREAGVGGAVPRGALVHALRHTFATRLGEDGASAVEIMRLLGHASLTTSQNYIDATAREQRAAIRSSRTHQVLRQLAGPGPADAPDIAAVQRNPSS